MVKIDYRSKRSKFNRVNSDLSLDFQKGQQNLLQTDKSDPESFQLVKNMYHEGGNAVLRNGYSLFKDEVYQELGMYDSSVGNALIAAKNDTTNTKIVSIDRSTGVESDLITGLALQAQSYFASLRGVLFATNGGDTNVHYYDGTTSGTLSFDYGGGATTPLHVASDDTRVWAVSDENPEQVLAFSNDRASSAVTATTWNAGGSAAIDRAGIAKSRITKFTGLIGAGKSIVAFAKDRVEVHSIPNFATNGITSFPANIPTIKQIGGAEMAYDRIGIDNGKAAIAVASDIYFISDDGVLYQLDSLSGRIKSFDYLRQIKDKYSFENCALGYNQDKNLIYIQAKELTNFDTVFVFNTTDESFSVYDNIFAKTWISDKDGVYFLDANQKPYLAFEQDEWKDNGLSIEWRITTQASYAGTNQAYKKAQDLFTHVMIWEDTSINADFIADRGIGATSEANNTVSRNESFELNPFNGTPQNYSQGMFGGSGLNYNIGNGSERVYNNDKINTNFIRYELSIYGSSKNNVIIKGIGLSYVPTNKKLKSITFNS